MKDLRNEVAVYNVGDHTLHASISLCVFMHDNYPLQIGVKLMLGEKYMGEIFHTNRSKNGKTATMDDLKKALADTRLQACINPKCDNMAFHIMHDSNRKGECEACFMGKLRAELYAEQAKEQLKMQKREAKLYANGFRWRVTATIHPLIGDDVLVDWYEKSKPTKAGVARFLKSKGSQVLDDYVITALEG